MKRKILFSSVIGIFVMALYACAPNARAAAPATPNPQTISSGVATALPTKEIRLEALHRLASRSLRRQALARPMSTASGYGTGILSTIAGGAFNQDGGLALNVGVGSPEGIAQDSSGNTYVAAPGFNEVLKIDSSGKITVVAGNGTGGYSGDGGPGNKAALNSPSALALDNAGNLYISDTSNSVIRKLNLSSGIITTIAGEGPTNTITTCQNSADIVGDGCPATQAALGQVYGLAFNATTGILYLADGGFGLVRQIDATGTMTAVAGAFQGGPGCANQVDAYADGCPATSATLLFPIGLAFDRSGRLYISDAGTNLIRMVQVGSSNPIISVVAGQANQTGTPESGYSGDGGPATSALLYEPGSVVIDSYDNLYFVDSGNSVLRRISNGVISTIAGTGEVFGFAGDGGPATSARLSVNYISGLAIDPLTGTLSFADTGNERIRQVLPNGNVQTVAGNGYQNYFGSGGPANLAGIGNPYGIAEDKAGNLYIADDNNIVWRVNAGAGVITTFAGTGAIGYTGDGGPAASAALSFPEGLAVDSAGNVLIADTGNSAIREVNAATGIITTVAGGLGPKPTVCAAATDSIGDGCPAAQASLSVPYAVAIDGAGDLYIADSGHEVIREISAASGLISTVAGTPGTAGYSGDGGAATSATLRFPGAVVLDSSGNLYIADTNNNVIRQVSPSTGAIQTIAGNGIYGYGGDGGPATSAMLADPHGVAIDSAGNLYFADSYNNVLREVDSTGTITTIAGNGTAGFSGDGGPAAQGEISIPWGLLIDNGGNLIFADNNNSRVRRISMSAAPVAPAVTVTASASTITSAQGLSVSVAVSGSGTATPTGSVILSSGSYTSTAAVLSSGSATIDIPAGVLAAGTDTLTATYTPDLSSSSAYTSATGTASVTVTAAYKTMLTPTVAVSPSATSISATQELSVAATVSGGSGNPTPTGTVTVSSGSYNSGPVALTNGSASIDIQPGMLSGGNDTLTASYNGDVNYNTATGTASVTVTSTTQITATSGGAAILNTGSVTLKSALGVATDSAGNLYVVDNDNSDVVKITTAGVASVLNIGAPGGVSLKYPQGIAIDGTGNLYIVDTGNNRIVEFSAGGTASVVNIGSPGGMSLNYPENIAADSKGNIYVTDNANNRVVEVPAGGAATVVNIGTVAGTGISDPTGIAVDSAGNLYIADEGNYRIVKVDSAGTPTVVSTGTLSIEPQGIATDSAGNIYIADSGSSRVVEVTAAGAAEVLTIVLPPNSLGCPGTGLCEPFGVATDQMGDIFVSDNGYGNVVKVTTAGSQALGQAAVGSAGTPVVVSFTIDGYGGDSYTPAFQMNLGKEATVGSVTCTGGPAPEICSAPVTFKPAYPGLREDAVNVLDPTSGNTLLGETLVYGTGTGPQAAFAPGTVSAVNLGSLTVMPQGTAVDPAGNLYIADTGNSRVVRVSATGTASVVDTGTLTLGSPQGVAVDGAGTLYVADTGNNRVVKVTAAGVVSTVSTGTLSVDPQGIAVDGAGTIYFTDGANRIVKVTASGAVSTLTAGSLNLAYAYGIAVDAQGNVYVANQGQNNIVEIPASGAASVVNTGNLTLSPANGVAVDSAGDVYIADSGNNRIVEVTPSGNASVLDIGTPGGNGFGDPYGITVDGAGNLYIADYGNNRVVQLAQAQALPLGFASTNVGSTSSDSPKAVTLQNIGNQALNISGVTTATTGQTTSSFNLSGSGTTCTTTTALAPGATCAVSVAFQPLIGGALSGTVNLTDNSLNAVAPNNVQQISLSGTGVMLVPAVKVNPSASSITTAQALNITVSVSGANGSPVPTGSVTVSGGGYTSASVTLTSGAATVSVPADSLSVGTDVLTATYTPDAGSSSIYSSASGTASVTVTAALAAATVTVTPSAATITDEQTDSVTVSVAGASGQPMPTGTVTLASGSYNAQQSLSGGSAKFTIPAGALSGGADTLTAAYSGDTAYAPGSGTATVTVSAVAISAPAPPAVNPGSSATATATLSAGSTYSGSMTLSCSLTSSPTGAQSLPTCNLNPTSVTLTAGGSATTVLTVATKAASNTASLDPFATDIWKLGGGGTVVAFVLLFGIPSRRRRWIAMIVLCGTVFTAGVVACGGGGSSQSSSPPTVPATTAGNYTFTITGTDSSNAKITTSVNVIIAVQ